MGIGGDEHLFNNEYVLVRSDTVGTEENVSSCVSSAGWTHPLVFLSVFVTEGSFGVTGYMFVVIAACLSGLRYTMSPNNFMCLIQSCLFMNWMFKQIPQRKRQCRACHIKHDHLKQNSNKKQTNFFLYISAY